jgi:hypothetical protein
MKSIFYFLQLIEGNVRQLRHLCVTGLLVIAVSLMYVSYTGALNEKDSCFVGPLQNLMVNCHLS